MEKIISLCKRRGFIFQGSEIYGGLANTWDYGPLGVELKNNVKRAWWKANIYGRFDMYGLDSAILMHPKTWEASGHTKNFNDILVDCKKCEKRLRVDKINGVCPYCGCQEFTEGRAFNLMFKTEIGVIADSTSIVYLRPETAQGIFVNFLNIIDSMHPKLPFGIGQIGKSFRNEITPGNFTFRTREFEQMEIEYFVKPSEAEKYYNEWIGARFNWYTNLGLNKECLRIRPHEKNELAHYALACSDIEYKFPFEGGDWQELEGIANRGDFDLKQHSEFSGKKLEYFDDATKEKFLPYVIEPSGGVDRATLAFLVDAYREEQVKDATRVVLKLHHRLAPYKIAVFPLLKNRPQIVELAKKIALDLKKYFITIYDDTGAIGKLYRRQDEIGTPFCLTVDVESMEDQKVTIRDRDTMIQDRVDISNLKKYFEEKLNT